MAIKRQAPQPTVEAAPSRIKRVGRVQQSSGEYLTKEDMVGRRWLIELLSYDAEYLGGKFGAQPRAIVNLIEVGGEEESAQSVWLFGNLGRNLGDWLSAGEIGLADVIKGTSKSGNEFIGANEIVDEESLTVAEAVLAKHGADVAPF